MDRILAAGVATSAVVAVLALAVWPLFGFVAAIATFAAVHLVLVAYHLWNLQALSRWAEGDPDVAVPEGRGVWRTVFTALYRRVRVRAAFQRDLANTIAQFRSAADAIPDGIVLLDAARRVRWANQRAHVHLGVDPEKDAGRPLANVARQPELAQYLARGDFSQPVTVDSMREPGVALSLQIVPFGEREQLLMSRDVTALQAVERMRRDFIANVSHELKTPLTVVAGFVETLRDLDVTPEAKRRYLGLMEAQTQSMRRLVDDLLTLSSLESPANEVAESAFAVDGLVAEIAVEARALSAGQHEVAVADHAPATIVGNREELRSAFANLVTNAVRYTPAGGRITLGWKVDADGTGRFSVSDTGIGIAPEHVPRLTERFYRVDRSRSRATGGTGLGLAIVKHVLLRHQADLAVESEPGKGSTFTVRLPRERVLRVAQDIGTAPVHLVGAREP